MWLFSAHPVLISFFGISIYTHGLFFALAAEISVLLLQYLAKKKGLSSEDIPVTGLCIFISGLLAARIGYFITYPTAFTSLIAVFEIWHGGLVSYFAIIAGLGAAYTLFKHQKGSVLLWLDLTCLSGLVGWSIGRLGNYYAHDSIGIINSHFALFYGRVPIQLFESFWCMLWGLLLIYLLFKNSVRQGSICFFVLGGYFAARIIIDTWRDEEYIFLHIHTSQLSSIFFLLITLGSYAQFRKRNV